MGFKGRIYKLIENYMTNRTQLTKNNGHFSSELAMKCGVPQGSTLGPLLFIPPYFIEEAKISYAIPSAGITQ